MSTQKARRASQHGGPNTSPLNRQATSDDRPTHHYHGDGLKDHNGRDRCATCGMPRSNIRHAVPEHESTDRRFGD